MLTNHTETLIIKSILTHGPEILNFADQCESLKSYKIICEQEKLDYPFPTKTEGEWFIPENYMQLDIESHLLNICPKENLQRLNAELDLYRKYDMTIILKAMKYLVDTMRSNKIVWGVGRGSSVASYALYLLGVHKIDSIKYNLSTDEFFKGEA